MQPRHYQQEVIEAVESGFDTHDKQLIVLPTGGGKTIVFSWLAKRQPGRTLILAHREELIEQAVAKLAAATGIGAEIEKAERWATKEAQVVVGSVQTMCGARLQRWPADHFSLVVCDEAHHSISDSWQKTLSHFDEHAQVLGVTATPDRGDKRNLGSYYEAVAAEVELLDLIRDGYLSPITVKLLPLAIDIRAVKQTAGDYDAGALGDALVPYLRSIAEAIREHASFRKVLCFLPLVHTSKLFVEACRECGLAARHVDGESPNRADILAAFARGEFDLLSNCSLLTEGYDDPTIDAVCVLRPTRSRPLYAQMVGRGTRVAPEMGKENLLLLDFLWQSQRHSLARPASLIAKSDEEADVIQALTEEKAKGGGQGELDIIGLASEAAETRHAALRKKLEEHKGKKSKFISAEEFAAQQGSGELLEYEPVMKWESLAVTEPQAKALRRAKIDVATVSGRRHASKLLSEVYRNQTLTFASDAEANTLWRARFMPRETRPTKADVRRFYGQMARRRAAVSERV